MSVISFERFKMEIFEDIFLRTEIFLKKKCDLQILANFSDKLGEPGV